MKRGTATFTLDTGHCPPWLFQRMVKLSREVVRLLVDEYGADEVIKRVADPVWFQSLGTVAAFDWNASGLTTILTAALKEAIRGEERDLGVFIAGGKGKTSRKTPEQIEQLAPQAALAPSKAKQLVYNSRMSAKVDSALIQDGYELYHHSFFFSQSGAWAVVQQGMNKRNRTARRYHWFSESIEDLICEPHSGIAAEKRTQAVLNLSAKESAQTRSLSTELVGGGFQSLMKDLTALEVHITPLSKVIRGERNGEEVVAAELAPVEFHSHPVQRERFAESPYLQKILHKLTEDTPKTYEQFLATEGVGPKTVRALALVSEVIYGTAPSYRDPARYSFAHGGKDATPYPVDRRTYDRVIGLFERAVKRAKVSPFEKEKALRRVSSL